MIEEILSLSAEQIIELTDRLAGLIGYDKEKGDIDELGASADETISKLLNIFYEKTDRK